VFDWDEENLKHISRHGVTSEEAEEVITNDLWKNKKQKVNSAFCMSEPQMRCAVLQSLLRGEAIWFG
jgi:uncharacterized DUF497 family protein